MRNRRRGCSRAKMANWLSQAALRAALAGAGPRGYWRKLLEFSLAGTNPPEDYDTAYCLAHIYAPLGETEQALSSLEKAYAAREIPLPELTTCRPTIDNSITSQKRDTCMQRRNSGVSGLGSTKRKDFGLLTSFVPAT